MKSLSRKKLSKKLLKFKEFFILFPVLSVISFNLAYHIFQTPPYFLGLYVNYLDPLLHGVDIGMMLVLVGLKSIKSTSSKLWYCEAKLNRIFLAAIVSLGILQLIISPTLITLYFTLRLLLYLVSAWFLLISIKNELLNVERLRSIFVWTLLAGGIIQSVIGICQFLNTRMLGLSFLGESQINMGGLTTSSVQLPSGYFLRAYGTFPHPNVLSGFLVLVLIVLFVNYEWIIKKLENTGIGGFIKNSLIFNGAFIIFSLIISAGILVTFSRIGWILMGFLWMLWLGVWINKKNKKLMKYYLIFLGVSFIGAVSLIMFVDLGIFVDIRNRLLLQSLFGDVSWQQRIDLAQKALKFTRKNLLFGTGFGNFLVRLSEDPIYMDSGIRLIQPAHNIFLMILVESGILGTLLIFVIVGLFIKLILSTHKINKNLMISLLALILLAGNLDHYLITLPQGLAMLCLLMPLMLIFPNGLKQG